MRDYDYVYPGYGFAQNMGYGTKEHLAGLEKMGQLLFIGVLLIPFQNI